MNHALIRYLSWVALALALFVWIGVGYFVWTISSEESGHASRVAQEEQESLRQSNALRLHALARETKDSRAKLESIARSDVIEILDMIEAVARDSGAAIKIGQALSASPSGEAPSLRIADFVLEAEGSFAKVSHVVALLESLPIPSSVNEIQFERVLGSIGGSGKSSSSLWRMVARVRFLTTADISS